MSEKIVGAGAIQRMVLYSRETGEKLSPAEAVPQLEASISQQALAVQVPVTRFHQIPFIRQHTVRAAAKDVKVGMETTNGHALAAYMQSIGLDYPVRSGIVNVGIAWVGKEHRRVLLAPLPAEWVRRYWHPLAYTPQATDGSGVVGQIDRPHGNSFSVTYMMAVHWDIKGETINLIHPQWATNSWAFGIDGKSVVGRADIGPDQFSILWKLGDSITLLAKNDEGAALAVKGDIQVGYRGPLKGNHHAARWKGTPESVYSLHQFLPREYFKSSASWIGENGIIYGTAERPGRTVGVRWKPNPLFRQ